MEYKELGKSGIRISAIGLGTWQWGSREWGWGKSYGKQNVLEAFKKAIEMGINFIDTAEMYGRGKSEKLIAEAIRDRREDVVIATKVSPWHLSYGGVLKAADRSMRRLGVNVIDLYQVHWPNQLIPIRSTMKAMKKLVQDGRVRSVGISNFNLNRTKSVQEALAPIDLASNQVKYNLFDRGIEGDFLSYAQKEKISIIAYSPLAQGLLTNKYSPGTRPGSFVQKINGRFSNQNLKRLTELSQVLAELGRTHNTTPSQVALNWLVAKNDVVAIPGIKRIEFVIDNAGATDWRLTQEEIKRLESAAENVRFDKASALPNALRAVIRS